MRTFVTVQTVLAIITHHSSRTQKIFEVVRITDFPLSLLIDMISFHYYYLSFLLLTILVHHPTKSFTIIILNKRNGFTRTHLYLSGQQQQENDDDNDCGELEIRTQTTRRSQRTSSTSPSPPSSTVGPKANSLRRNNHRRRRETSFIRDDDKTETNNVIVNPKELTSLQVSNDDAMVLDVMSSIDSPLRMKSSHVVTSNSSPSLDNEDIIDNPIKGNIIDHAHFEYISLDDLFPNLNFSKTFYTNGKFREDIRKAMRKDVFDTTLAYENLSPKVAAYMLDDDSSLEGSWNCRPFQSDNDNSTNIRMRRLTSVLNDYLGKNAPTGDAFMMKIGSLCGTNPSTHWIDIIGVKNRIVSHSWHQDSGISFDKSIMSMERTERLIKSRYTVMLGFPQEDEYEGTGVFSHAIKLAHECLAPHNHNVNEPVLFEGIVDQELIVRPSFSFKREIIRYRDIDILHSAPDIVYRRSLMRFM